MIQDTASGTPSLQTRGETPTKRSTAGLRCAGALAAAFLFLGAPTPSAAGPAGVAAGRGFTAVLQEDGTVQVWGTLWDGALRATPVPLAFAPGVTITEISAGDAHLLALDSTGKVWTCGADDMEQLGNGAAGAPANPLQAVEVIDATDAPLTGVTSIATGNVHNAAVKAGKVYAWGYADQGRVGDGDASDHVVSKATAVNDSVHSALKTVVQVTAGDIYTVARNSDGSLAAWGGDGDEQLGNGPGPYNVDGDPNSGPKAQPNPVPVDLSNLPSGVTVTAVSVGCGNSLALGSNGRVYHWGFTHADPADSAARVHTPTEFSALTAALSPAKVVAVAAGKSHNLAITDGGVLWAWGTNPNGALGNGTATGDSELVVAQAPVSLGTARVALVAGYRQTVAVADDGYVWVWGGNDGGEVRADTAPEAVLSPYRTAVQAFTPAPPPEDSSDGDDDSLCFVQTAGSAGLFPIGGALLAALFASRLLRRRQ